MILRRWARPIEIAIAVCCLLSLARASGYASTGKRSFDSAGTSGGSPYTPHLDAPEWHFAIADFDGDRQPDVATVELTRFNALHSRYSVSFQLSKGRPVTIGLTAPAGGLLLVARDVNGDRAPDLILVTARRHELLAVLLNDGAGNFATADPRQFDKWSGGDLRVGQLVLITPPGLVTVLASQRSFAGDLNGGHLAYPASGSEPSFCGSSEFTIQNSASSILSRAPPALVFHL